MRVIAASSFLVALLSAAGAVEAFAPSSPPSFGSISATLRRNHDIAGAPASPASRRGGELSMIANFKFPWRADESTTSAPAAANEYDEKIEYSLELLKRAADSRDEDPDEVLAALEDLEKLMRTKCKSEPECAQEILNNLNGSWRLIFTTGTKKTQDRIKAKINYFPIKAVQSFDTTTDPFGIENGIYLGDFAALKFGGYFDFDLIKRKLEFDFTSISILGFEIQIKSTDAAKIGASTGLGSESNVANSEKGKRPFFNWISADGDVATARGGGGGLALWKRIPSSSEE